MAEFICKNNFCGNRIRLPNDYEGEVQCLNKCNADYKVKVKEGDVLYAKQLSSGKAV